MRKTGAIAIALAWTAYIGYCVLNQSGLQAFFISLENRIFGAYEPVLTAILLWLVPILIVLARVVPEWVLPAAEIEVDPNGSDPTGQTAERAEIARLSKSIPFVGWTLVIGMLVAAGATFAGPPTGKRAALPVLVREVYEEAGINVPARTYILEQSVTDLREAMFMTALITGLIVLSIFGILLGQVIKRRRLRKALHAAQNPLG